MQGTGEDCEVFLRPRDFRFNPNLVSLFLHNSTTHCPHLVIATYPNFQKKQVGGYTGTNKETCFDYLVLDEAHNG